MGEGERAGLLDYIVTKGQDKTSGRELQKVVISK